MWPGFGSSWGGIARSLTSSILGNRTARGALLGAGAGAVYGAFSDRTSALGGAVTGGLVGAGVARYGGAGLAASRGIGAGMGFRAHAGAMGRAFGTGISNQLRLDYRGARMAANQGYSHIRGIFK